MRALAVVILVGGLLLLAAPVAAQAVPADEPTLGMLASTAGLSVVIGLLMQLLRGPMEPASFDQWAPAIAVVIGVALAELYVLVTGPVTGESIVQGALVGLFAGILSQNVNTVIRRSLAPPPPG